MWPKILNKYLWSSIFGKIFFIKELILSQNFILGEIWSIFLQFWPKSWPITSDFSEAKSNLEICFSLCQKFARQVLWSVLNHSYESSDNENLVYNVSLKSLQTLESFLNYLIAFTRKIFKCHNFFLTCLYLTKTFSFKL